MILENLKRSKSDVSRENLKKAIAARIKDSRETKVCHGCGKECSVTRAWIKKGWKYCSWDCRIKNMKGGEAPNANGGEWMKGENNINYKHGKSAELSNRDWGAVRKWRRRVYERDKYACQRCGYNKGKVLQAHHIHSWSQFPDLRYEISNGITMCISCHKWIHSKQNVNKEYIKCN